MLICLNNIDQRRLKLIYDGHREEFMAEMEFELSSGLIYLLNKKGHLTNFLGQK